VSKVLRILLVGRRFWPHVSVDAGGHLYQLARAIARQGAAVEVLTPRYSSSWPTNFSIHEIPVHRPILAARSDWSMGRYARSMTRWLRQHSASYDLIFCDSIREEAVAAIEATRGQRRPVVLRAGGWGIHSDAHWWTTSRAAQRCGAIGRMAESVIVSSASSQRDLLSIGYAPHKVFRIDPGFAAGAIRTSASRRQARQVLAAVNSDLATSDDTPVLVCPSRLVRGGGIDALVTAARQLVARYPDLRLWFVGDGPDRDWIHDTLRGDGLRASIAMPGSFSDIGDVLAAADVYFHTGDENLEFWLPAAIAAGLPIVAQPSPAALAVIDDRHPLQRGDQSPAQWVHWCQADEHGLVTAESVRGAVSDVLDNLSVATERAGQLRLHELRYRPQVDAIERHLSLFHKVVGGSSAPRRGESMETTS
jgi:glycosyltransferase involved in cell wall biosynthesis